MGDKIDRDAVLKAITETAVKWGVTGEPAILIATKAAIRAIPAAAPAEDARAGALKEAVERARGLLPTYDSAEIQDGTILLWAEGKLALRVSFDMWFERAEPYNKEAIVCDLLDLFYARQELRALIPEAKP